MQGSKTSMSDLVGEAIDRNASNAFQRSFPIQRGRTLTFHNEEAGFQGKNSVEGTKNHKMFVDDRGKSSDDRKS